MIFIWLLLSVRGDYLISTPKGAQEIMCPEYLCDLCSSSAAYALDNDYIQTQSFEIPDHLSSTSKLAAKQVSELVKEVNGTVLVSIGTHWICAQVTNITTPPTLPGLYNTLLNTKLSRYNFIESISVSTVANVYTRSERAGTGVVWNLVHVNYLDVKNSLEDLNVTEIREMVDRDTQVVTYYGYTGIIGNGSFTIETMYTRLVGQSFYVVVDDYGNLLNAIQNDFNCSAVVTPRGISDIGSLVSKTSELFYVSGHNGFNLTNIKVYTYPPSFSPGQGVLIKKGTGILTIDPVNQTCYINITGMNGIYPISLISDSSSWNMTMTTDFINFYDLESLIQSFYFDPITIFPRYTRSSEILTSLYNIQLSHPSIFINYLAAPAIHVQSSGKILEPGDCEIAGDISRIDTVVQSSFYISSITNSSMSYLLQIDSGSGSIATSSGTDKFQSTYGITFNSSNTTGVFFPQDFYMRKYLGLYNLTESIALNNTYQVYYIEPYQPEQLSGEVYLNIDGLSDLYFNVNVTMDKNQSFLKGLMENSWEEPFGVESLTVEIARLDWKIVNNTNVTQSNLCEAYFTCKNSVCWSGIGNIVLSNGANEVILHMNPVSSDILFETLYSTHSTQLTSGLEFLSEILMNISTTSKDFSTKGKFLGVLCKIKGFFTDFDLIDLYLVPFDLGHGNILVSNETNLVFGELTVTPGYLSGYLSGEVSLWDIKNTLLISVNENIIEFTVTGYPFNGIFNMSIDCVVLVTSDISSSTVELTSYLSDTDTQEISVLVDSYLFEWVDKGTTTLGLSDKYMIETQGLVVPADCDCEMIEICSTPMELECLEYSYDLECVQNASYCNSIKLACDSVTEYCLKSETTCSKWDKRMPNTCKTQQTVCKSQLTVCNDWDSECLQTESGSCQQYYLNSTDYCIKYEYKCNTIQLTDPECQAQCDYETTLNAQSSQNAIIYQAAYNQTQQDLQGFVTLSSLSSLFELIQVKLDRELDEIVDSDEVRMGLKAYIYCIDTSKLEIFYTDLAWNFFDIDEVTKSVNTWARDVIVDRSAGTLDSRLKDRAPLTVFLENIK
jgi:hypothetical protein